MSSYIRRGSTRLSDETMDDETDDKDDTKRKSRNLSEKKRRDQFNMLVNELGSMVTTNTRKMDKSTVLKSTISFLKNHNDIAVRSRAHEIQEDWKPSFLSNEEFTHLILEALDGFIMVFSSNGRIYYASESVTSLLGYLPSELANATIYEIAYQEDQSHLYNVLLNPGNSQEQHNIDKENQVSFTCHIKRGGLDFREEEVYELVQFVGYFRSDVDTDIDSLIPSSRFGEIIGNDTKLVFVGTGRLQTPQLIREMSVVDSTKSEFTSRHSLEWKFLFLDHRAPPIIGYLPFEVLGTSGYDYYHVDDLDNVVTCHEALMQKGEGTSCHYRFLTKGQQWIWLQTRFYITYNQWNSKPEFIVCTHRVVSYVDVMKQLRKNPEEFDKCRDSDIVLSPFKHQQQQVATSSHSGIPSSPWSSKSSKASRSVVAAGSRTRYQGGSTSDTTSMSAGSQGSRHSHQTAHSSRARLGSANSVANKPAADVPTGRKQPEVDEPCATFLEPPQYFAAIPVQPVITAGFTAPAVPVISSLPVPELLHQQSIVMTPAQNHIQDELQKKHEELQQLIVHQQEELRRVSEQLLIAKYGILSPLLNVSVPYSAVQCQQTGLRVSSTTSSMGHPTPSPGVQGVSVLQAPITLPVPMVPTELFAHSLPVSPVPTTSQQHSALSQHPQQHQTQQQQTSGPLTQNDGTCIELMPYQICSQQADVMYSNIGSPTNTHRSGQN